MARMMRHPWWVEEENPFAALERGSQRRTGWPQGWGYQTRAKEWTPPIDMFNKREQLVLRAELQDRLESSGVCLEWAAMLRDLESLQQVEVEHQDKRFLLRSELEGSCSTVFRSVGVAIPPAIEKL